MILKSRNCEYCKWNVGLILIFFKPWLERSNRINWTVVVQQEVIPCKKQYLDHRIYAVRKLCKKSINIVRFFFFFGIWIWTFDVLTQVNKKMNFWMRQKVRKICLIEQNRVKAREREKEGTFKRVSFCNKMPIAFTLLSQKLYLRSQFFYTFSFTS